MMPLNNILGKCIEGYKITASEEIINPRMYIDDIEQFAKNKKES